MHGKTKTMLGTKHAYIETILYSYILFHYITACFSGGLKRGKNIHRESNCVQAAQKKKRNVACGRAWMFVCMLSAYV